MTIQPQALLERLDNPIVGKDAISRMRSWRAVVSLSLYLLLVGGFGYAAYGIASLTGPFGRPVVGQVGSEVFSAMAIFQLVLISLFVPALTAGAISGERERQTFDLLLVSRVSAWGIVWGKLVASLAYALLLIVVALPLFAVVFLFGGVDAGQFELSILITVCTALAVGSLGLLSSATFNRSLPSTVASYGLAFCYLGLTGLVGLIILGFESMGMSGRSGLPANPVLLVNPIYGLVSVLFQAPGSGFSPAGLVGAAMLNRSSGTVQAGQLIQVWQITVGTELAVSALCLWGAVRRVRGARTPARASGVAR